MASSSSRLAQIFPEAPVQHRPGQFWQAEPSKENGYAGSCSSMAWCIFGFWVFIARGLKGTWDSPVLGFSGEVTPRGIRCILRRRSGSGHGRFQADDPSRGGALRGGIGRPGAGDLAGVVPVRWAAETSLCPRGSSRPEPTRVGPAATRRGGITLPPSFFSPGDHPTEELARGACRGPAPEDLDPWPA